MVRAEKCKGSIELELRLDELDHHELIQAKIYFLPSRSVVSIMFLVLNVQMATMQYQTRESSRIRRTFFCQANDSDMLARDRKRRMAKSSRLSSCGLELASDDLPTSCIINLVQGAPIKK